MSCSSIVNMSKIMRSRLQFSASSSSYSLIWKKEFSKKAQPSDKEFSSKAKKVEPSKKPSGIIMPPSWKKKPSARPGIIMPSAWKKGPQIQPAKAARKILQPFHNFCLEEFKTTPTLFRVPRDLIMPPSFAVKGLTKAEIILFYRSKRRVPCDLCREGVAKLDFGKTFFEDCKDVDGNITNHIQRFHKMKKEEVVLCDSCGCPCSSKEALQLHKSRQDMFGCPAFEGESRDELHERLQKECDWAVGIEEEEEDEDEEEEGGSEEEKGHSK